MAIYTVLNIDNVREIMSRYGIEDVNHFAELSGGSQNSNYVVRSQNVDFVLSICEQNTTEEIENLARLLEHLADKNFSTSILVRTNQNKTLTYWENKPVMVKKFIKGIVKDNISKQIAELIGIEIGKLHKVPSPEYLPQSLSYGKEYFHELEKYADGSNFQKWLLKKEVYFDAHISNALPKAFIHSDVFTSNVIIDSSQQFVTIMDFEEATYYYRIFDVGMAIIGICREGQSISFEKAKSLLHGYKQEINLNTEESSSLQAIVVYAATAMSFWRHKNFHYVVPTPSLHNHYIELKQIADTIYNMENDEFMSLIC